MDKKSKAPRATPNRPTYGALIKLAKFVEANKAEIQDQISKGKTVQAIAEGHGVSLSTMRSVLDEAAITHGRALGPKTPPAKGKLFTDALIVLARIARQLDVKHDEIKPYLPANIDELI